MITDEMLDALRTRIGSLMSEHRYSHTLGVEKMAAFLSEFCLPEKEKELRAAALLHDVTKELSYEEQLCMLADIENLSNAKLSSSDMEPAVIHSFTAQVVVKRDFKEFATDEIVSAVTKHTVGDIDMSVFDKIIFLADFIEETRTYQASVDTRNFVINSMKNGEISQNSETLVKACIMEINSTISHLKAMGKVVNEKTVLAKAALLSKK